MIFTENNVCNFVPYHNDCDSIHTINFVLETKRQVFEKLKIESVYKMHIVSGGTGFFHTPGGVRECRTGDVFFTFPASPFCIESGENFSYMYISFLGTRGNMITDKLNITPSNCFFEGFSHLLDFWKDALNIGQHLSDLSGEAVLLYTFAHIGKKYVHAEKNEENGADAVSIIKKYVDDNFSDPSLSLKKISKNVGYSEKYISAVFKQKFKMGYCKYLNTIRIQYACTMINQGYRSIGDIAMLCGYTDTHYFSNVFKKRTGIPPRKYIERQD